MWGAVEVLRNTFYERWLVRNKSGEGNGVEQYVTAKQEPSKYEPILRYG